jgi:hypothetical protein
MIWHTQCCLHVKGTVWRDFNLVFLSPNFKLISNPSPSGADNFGYTVLKRKTFRYSRRAKNVREYSDVGLPSFSDSISASFRTNGLPKKVRKFELSFIPCKDLINLNSDVSEETGELNLKKCDREIKIRDNLSLLSLTLKDSHPEFNTLIFCCCVINPFHSQPHSIQL